MGEGKKNEVEGIRKMIGIGQEVPIVFVSFGSVVDMGIFKEEDLQKAKDELKNADEYLKHQKGVAKGAEEHVEKAKKHILLIEDSFAKEAAMLDVFGEFNGQTEGGKAQAQFIWKYGKHRQNGPYEKVKDNVHGKAWLPQMEILGKTIQLIN
jgi:hypothetical protein